MPRRTPVKIGATGMVGSRVATEALRRDHQITAATRSGRADALHADPALATVALDAPVPPRIA